MSLPEAVKDIAQQMEDDASGKDAVPALMLSFYAKMLQSAVKAAEGVVVQKTSDLANIDPMSHHRRMIEKAKAERRANAQEGIGSRMAEVVGGPIDGTMVEIAGSMPVNAFTRVGNQVYILRSDGRLHHSEEETEYRNEEERIKHLNHD